MDAETQHNVPRSLVQRRHLGIELLQQRLVDKTGLGRRRDNTDAERLRQNQCVSRFCVRIREHLCRVDEACHSQAVDRLRTMDCVTAGDDRPGLIRLIVAAAQNLPHGSLVHLLRKAQNVQRQLRLTAHRVDVAERVRRGDLPIEERIVDNRRKKIGCLHNGHVVRDLIDACVVALVVPNDQPRVAVCAEAFKHLRERPRADLCAAPGARRQLGQPDISFHPYAPFHRPLQSDLPPRGQFGRSPPHRRRTVRQTAPRSVHTSRRSLTGCAAPAWCALQSPAPGRAFDSGLHRNGRRT